MAERSVYCGKSENGCFGRERESDAGLGGPPNRCVLFYVGVRVR